MTRVLHAGRGLVVLALVAAAAGCGREAPSDRGAQGGSPATQSASPDVTLPATTPPPESDVDEVTWALYRDASTLNPIQSLDYPETTVVSAMCDALLRQAPDGQVEPGISELPEYPDPRTIVFRLRSGVTFSDGKPVTADDVVYSLRRAADPSVSFYSTNFDRVESITATDPATVTVKLSKPDYWLEGKLAAMSGITVQRAHAEPLGRALGTPKGGIVCSGPYRLESWKVGSDLTLVRNDDYWDAEARGKVRRYVFKGVADDASLTTGLVTGGIDGTYPSALSTLSQLQDNAELTVTFGPSLKIDAFVISSLKGVLSDVRVRQALSMAIDRNAYIESAYQGAAYIPRTMANPGTWGYARDIFAADWEKLPEPLFDVAKAKSLVAEAGAAGKTLTIGMSPQINVTNTQANTLRSAAESIGLKVRFKAVSAQNFINFFSDPKAREGVDGFPTVNYPDNADPAAMYTQFVAPGGNQNFSGFEDPAINEAMDQAQITADPEERAKLVARAGKLIAEELPWIPLAAPKTVLITRKGLTGAPSSMVYTGGHWANMLGGA